MSFVLNSYPKILSAQLLEVYRPLMRDLLGWKYSSAFAFSFWIGGFFLMRGDPDLALAGLFIGGLWLLGSWLVSHPAPRRKNGQAFTKKQRQVLLTRWVPFACFFIVTVLLCEYCLYQRNQLILAEYNGVLLPGNVTPPQSCGDLPPGALVINLGSLSAYSETFPKTIVEIEGKPIVILDRDEAGGVAVTTDVFDENDDLVAAIERNKFLVVKDALIQRPNRSILNVIIKHKKERVLQVRYFNKQVLEILGVFRTQNHFKLNVTESDIIFNDHWYAPTSMCFGTSEPSAPLFSFSRTSSGGGTVGIGK